jgi:hypothetical protein
MSDVVTDQVILPIWPIAIGVVAVLAAAVLLVWVFAGDRRR